jgi:hypothetical protein
VTTVASLIRSRRRPDERAHAGAVLGIAEEHEGRPET